MGELAFAKYSGLTIDTDQYEWTDKGADFRAWYPGQLTTLDIRTSNKEPYALMVKEGTLKADYYILAHLDDLTVRFYGMASQQELRNRPKVETPYEHRNWEVPVDELEALPEPEELTPIGEAKRRP